VEVMLALNRSLEIVYGEAALEWLFGGWRTWAWMSVPLAYGLYAAGFDHPPLFTGFHFSWFLNPHMVYVYVDPNQVSKSVFSCLGFLYLDLSDLNSNQVKSSHVKSSQDNLNQTKS
jgi:hypothetical protein